ncbi:MAG: hypothetical protein K1Y36_06400 [Blastocatellia bacterium]|nr:hypothetical protein [Blastocatellia bacterium]
MLFRRFFTLPPRVFISLNLLATLALTWMGTQFHQPQEVLAVSSWGGGTPTTSSITAFATLRPWWKRNQPEGFQVRPSGEVEPVVRIPRDRITTTEEASLPLRGIGFDLLCGWETTVRSGFSADLIFDFGWLVRLHQFWLVAAWTLLPLGLYWSSDFFRHPIIFFYFNCTHLGLLLVRSNKAKFLTEGIIDSALANPLALVVVLAGWGICRAGGMTTRKHQVIIFLCGFILGFCTLVRGEFFFLVGLIFLYLGLFAFFHYKDIRRGVCISFFIFLLCPFSYGVFNLIQFGHFVPLRMQSGQNLLEPIGQYPNPFGIEYRDEWVMEYLTGQKIEYISFAADQHLTQRYFALLKEHPGVFFKHFYLRCQYFSKQFGYLINLWVLPFLLLGIFYYSARDKNFLIVFLPLVLTIGYFLFFGWTNNLLRLVTPIHFLLNAFLCVGMCGWLLHRKGMKPATGAENLI